MGILQKVKTVKTIKYNCLKINDYREIPAETELVCIDHIVCEGYLFALCIYKGGMRVIHPEDLVYY